MIAALALVTIAACSSGQEAASSDSRFPIAVTDARVEVGSTLYATNCASCHGVPGVSPPTLPTAPPHTENGHTWHHPDRSLYDWILDRPPLAKIMPPFRGLLTEDEIRSIVAYIKSTWPEPVQKIQREGTIQYERQLRENS